MNFIRKYLLRRFSTPAKEAKKLVHLVSKSANEIFNDKKLREACDYDKLEKTEQDRVFNELQATAMIYLNNFLDDRLKFVRESRKDFWQDVFDGVNTYFIDWLREIKIQEEFVETWRKLLELRQEEYEDNKIETKNLLWQEEISDPSEKINDALVRVETLRISCLLHITRGKAKPDHPLAKILSIWLIGLNSQLERLTGW